MRLPLIQTTICSAIAIAVSSGPLAATAAMKPTGGDAAFAKAAAQGGMAEVMLGRNAAAHASDPRIKQFGRKMVIDHSRANGDMKRTAKMLHFRLPLTPNAEQIGEEAKLMVMRGHKFDREYVDAMVKDHKEDLEAFKNEAANGTNPALKSFATRYVPMIKMHMVMIEHIQMILDGKGKMPMNKM